MINKVVIIKVLNGNSAGENIIRYAEESFDTKEIRFYNVQENDREILSEFENDDENIVVIVSYEEDREKRKFLIAELFIGYGNVNGKGNINYVIKKRVTKVQLMIKNFVSNSELDLKEDFERKSYISIARSKVLIKQLESYINEPAKLQLSNNVEYKDKYNNLQLDDMAQHNKDCKRIIGILSEQEDRSEFQRDRERIINSKSFRRLVDKAQIFTSSKGDHYRTRMTHTLEVSQIARAISSALNLNNDLTEAIALAHDIGHTPFGHQGERTLDTILKNKIRIIEIPKDLEDNFYNEFGGFKHNYQGLRVLTRLEEKYIDFSGLDISMQVLEGVLKHTNLKIKDCPKCGKCKKCYNCNECVEYENKCEQDCFDLLNFVDVKYKVELNSTQKYASTLEGQIVAIADEIAQRGHDVDDAFLSGLLSEDEFMDCLNIKPMKALSDIILKSYNDLKDGKRSFVDRDALFRARIISDIVSYFINDILKASRNNIKEFKENGDVNNRVYNKLIISFTSEGKRANDYLEKIISKKAINSSEVSKFDNNAEAIIIGLFKAYYDNPKLMHKDILMRTYFDFKNSPHECVSNNIIDFINGDFILVKKELKDITKLKISQVDYTGKEDESDDERSERYINIEYWEKRKILVRNIVDYISGMTDSYATNEYNSIVHKTF